MLFFAIGWFQRRGAGAWRSGVTLNPPRGYPHAVIAGGVICAALVGGILLRGVVLLGADSTLWLSLLVLVVVLLWVVLWYCFRCCHSLVVARCADQVGGGSPQAFTRLGVSINGSVGSAYRCGIQVKVGQVAHLQVDASSTSTMVT